MLGSKLGVIDRCTLCKFSSAFRYSSWCCEVKPIPVAPGAIGLAVESEGAGVGGATGWSVGAWVTPDIGMNGCAIEGSTDCIGGEGNGSLVTRADLAKLSIENEFFFSIWAFCWASLSLYQIDWNSTVNGINRKFSFEKRFQEFVWVKHFNYERKIRYFDVLCLYRMIYYSKGHERGVILSFFDRNNKQTNISLRKIQFNLVI